MGRTAWLCLLLAAASGCAGTSFERGLFEKDETRYQLQAPPPPWEAVHVADADLAFYHQATKATIILHATCNEYEDAPLDVLLRHLLFGFTEREVRREEIVPFDEREALRASLQAKLDGVSVAIEALVMKKSSCIYDLTLAVATDHLASVAPDFEALLASFHALPRDGAP